jgi:RHS repeat-associated protein
MRISHPASHTLLSLLSLSLAYTLFIMLCAPFIVRPVKAASLPDRRIPSTAPAGAASKPGGAGAVGASAAVGQGIESGRADQFRVTPPAPRRGVPLPNLPNLEEIRKRRHQPHHAPPPIPSTRCSPHSRGCNRGNRSIVENSTEPAPAALPNNSQQASQQSTALGLLASNSSFPALESLLGLDKDIVSDSPFAVKWPLALLTPALQSPGSSARFIKTDATTQGNWKGTYGSDGYHIINDSASYPAYAQVTSGIASYTWAASAASVRALQKSAPGNADRIAACLHQASYFTIDVNITDGHTHRIALYSLDWDSVNQRSQRVDILDASTNTVLDSRSVSAFSDGKYLVWNISGHVVIKVTQTGVANSVLSGLFFDPPRINVALATQGGFASASSTTPDNAFPGSEFHASAVNDGNRSGSTYPVNGFWRDNTAGFDDWVQVAFDGNKTIDEIDVFTVQDAIETNPVEPTETQTFTLYGITRFDVQYWNGSAWMTVPGGQVSTDNYNVWRRFTFTPVTTDKIRVLVHNALSNQSRVVELEAYAAASPNVALAINGGTATASSSTPNGQFPGYNFSPSVAIDGDRKSGVNFWRDDTPNTYPDLLQVQFAGVKNISEIDVFTLQDNDQNPSEPTEAMTFTLNGITAFKVEYWNGSVWATVPGAEVTENQARKVWRKFTFTPVATEKIRVHVTGALANHSRIVEVEAYEHSSTTGNGSTQSNAAETAKARLDAVNRTGMHGEDLVSGNYSWGVPLVSLPGRAGLDLSLSLSYNSLVWTKADQTITYDADQGSPSPGFRLGFPTIQPLFYNSQTEKNAYLLITPSGSHVELRQSATNPAVYEAADSSYLQLDAAQMILRSTDGTQFSYAFKGGEYVCTEIKDANGNFITVNYNDFGQITSIIDTLARTVTFNYDTNHNLLSITEQRNGQTQPWPVATFGYSNLTLHTNFNQLAVTGSIQNGATIPVLTQVGLDDGTRYNFTYTTWGQISRIDHYVQDSVNTNNWTLLNYIYYNLPADDSTAQSDCPRYTEKRVWAVGWNGDTEGVPAAAEEAVTVFSAFNFAGGSRELTVPDGTTYKEFFATTGRQRGLTTLSEVWSGGVKQKWTTIEWTQDSTSVSYQLNPRPIETNIYDAFNNRRRKTIDYGAYAVYGLPYLITEYGSNATSVLRRTYTDYKMDADYLNRRIIGLTSAIHVSDGQSWLAKLVYAYDAGGSQLTATPSPAVQHDPAYDTFAGARGLLTSVARYDATDLENAGKATVMQIGYNTDGSVIFTRDPLGHQTSLGYTDSFSDAASHPATFAYPTTVTNADGYSQSLQYDYYLGAVSRLIDPKGATVINTYDTAGRIDRVSNTFNNAFKQFHYGTRYVVTLTSVKNLTEPAYAISWTDGLGQPYAVAQDAPVPGETQTRFSGQVMAYDVMGRMKWQTNPTEIGEGWIPSGVDAAGWQFTHQTYDWKGRPRVTIHPDGATREALYDGCGCAGGEVTTTRDERGRRRRHTLDVLGRLSRVEELNWDQSLYSTIEYSYNALDRITNINHAGQVRSFEYDGHGRLSATTTPEQGHTTFSYFPDDLTQTVTDARGATATFAYNGRHLVTSITYGVPAGVSSTPNVSFSYDEAGNRTLMSDGLGYADYHYNTLSQLTSEGRYFNDLNQLYTTQYGYDLAGELTSMTMPWGEQVAYARDHVGRVTGVSGYAGAVQYASNLQYRAFGALRQISYGNGRALSLSYDARMRLTRWDMPNVMGWEYHYDTPNINENTNRVAYARNLYDPTLDRSYDYDHVGRLWASHTGTEARGHSGVGPGGPADGPYAFNQAYDVYGNVTQRNGWGGWNFAFQSATFVNNRMQANPQTGAAMQYDASGNLTNDGQESYIYDATGQQSYASGTNLYQYYDGDSLRAKKVEGGVASYYVRSSMLDQQVVGEISNNVWKRAYVYLGTEKLILQESGQTRWVHADPVTKSQRATDASGAVVSVIDLDPFGGETARSSNVQLMSTRFTTYERDGNGGDEAQARRFEGQWTRFSQPDPSNRSYRLSDPQSFNRYTYAGNDPVNRRDPSGLEGIPNIGNVDIPISWGSSGGFLHGFGDFGGGTILDELTPSESLSGLSLDLHPQNDKLPDFVRDFYRDYGQKFNNCMREIFGSRTARAVGRQTLSNAPNVDMSRPSSQMPGRAYGSLSQDSRNPRGTVNIASDITNIPLPGGGGISAHEMRMRTYGHELGNLTANRAAGLAGRPGRANELYGTPGGLPGSITGYRDPDPGARFEKCVFGSFAS